MKPLKDLFKDVRPSDLRFDNVHILAEYITQTQKLADCVMSIHESAEQLVQSAMKSTEAGITSVRSVQQQLEIDFQVQLRQLSRVVNMAGGTIAKAVADAHASGASYLDDMGETVKARYEGLESRAEELERLAKRLELAAVRAEEDRRSAYEEHERLRAFEIELGKYERECMKRIADARASLEVGVGLWQRIWNVPFPPAISVRTAQAPKRNSIPSNPPKASVELQGGREPTQTGRASLAYGDQGK